jgi:hypothetical protein
MGEAGHDRGGMMFGQVDQCDARAWIQLLQDTVDGVAQPQAHVGGDLVVARAAGVQPLAGIADLAGQCPLDVEMDVFVVQVPRETPGFEVGQNFAQAAADVGQILAVSTPTCAAWRRAPASPGCRTAPAASRTESRRYSA